MPKLKIKVKKLTREEYMDAQYNLYVKDYKKKSKRLDPLSDLLSKEDYLTVRELEPNIDNKGLLNKQFYKLERSTAYKIYKELGLKHYKDIWRFGVNTEIRNKLSNSYHKLLSDGLSSKAAAALTYDIWYADSP